MTRIKVSDDARAKDCMLRQYQHSINELRSISCDMSTTECDVVTVRLACCRYTPYEFKFELPSRDAKALANGMLTETAAQALKRDSDLDYVLRHDQIEWQVFEIEDAKP